MIAHRPLVQIFDKVVTSPASAQPCAQLCSQVDAWLTGVEDPECGSTVTLKCAHLPPTHRGGGRSARLA